MFKLKNKINAFRKKIILQEVDLDICQTFAEAVYDSNKQEYKRRSQGNRNVIIRQIVCGKMAELAVYDFFNQLELKPTFPDFEVYGKEQKSFDSDISFNHNKMFVGCHVKSQDILRGQIYSPSWLFQKNKDSLVRYPQKHKNDLLVFVQMNGFFAKIMGVVWVPEVTLFFKPPKLAYLKTKTALYFNDLIEAGIV